MKMPIIAAIIFAASTAHATPWTIPDGNGGWTDNPACTDCPKTDPVAPEPTQPKGDPDRDPSPLATQQHYGFCCTDQHTGVTRFHTAWLRDPATAKAQCDAKPIEDLRACPDRIQRQIDAADGVE